MKVSELAKSLGYKANEFIEFVAALDIGISIDRKDIPFNVSQAIRQKVPHLKGLDDNQKEILRQIREKVKNKAKKKKVDKEMKAEQTKARKEKKSLKKRIKEAEKPQKLKKTELEETRAQSDDKIKEDMREKTKEEVEENKQKATQLQPQVIIEEIQSKDKKRREELKENILNVRERTLNVKVMGNIDLDYVDKSKQGVGKISEYRSTAKSVRRQFRKKVYQKHRRDDGRKKKDEVKYVKPEKPSRITVKIPISLRDFSEQSGIKIKDAQRILKLNNRNISADSQLTEDDVILIGLENKMEVSTVKQETKEEAMLKGIEEQSDNLVSRHPVVTFMGHVDHGKTTILDFIRKSQVAEKEAGGITQHIGATQVVLGDEKKITFIDTPGHEAFTAMRARGANITDIVVLVVAADEGVMPQTIEALNHAKDAGCAIVVAVNKVDKPQAQPDKVRNEVSKYELIPEDWGGDTLYVEVSGKTGKNIDKLLESILLQAEMMELKADPTSMAQGTVLEASKSDKEGVKATVLVTSGTLKKGDIIIAGDCYGRIREMLDSNRKPVSVAPPSTPVEVLGLNGVPEAGDKFYKVESVKVAAEIVKERGAAKTKPPVAVRKSLQDLLGEKKELKFILKCDTRGSVEAIRESLDKIQAEDVKLKVIHAEVGKVNESDMLLATASNAIILAFNTDADNKARQIEKSKNIQVKKYSIIYDLLDDVEKMLRGEIEPEYKEEILGKVLVKKVFNISKAGRIAGCYVESGKVKRNALCRVKRKGQVLCEDKVVGLKRFKDDVREVQEKFECGISLGDFNDFEDGDIIEVYEEVEVQPSV